MSASALRELAVIAVVAVVTYLLAGHFEVFERFVAWSAEHQDWRLDDLISLSVILSLGVAVFAYRRWRELGREMARRRAVEEALTAMALHDPLTGLPNRRLLQDRTQQALLAAARARQGCALLLVDLNGFKAVNDRFGHAAGDEALAAIARRFAETLRAADTVARLGGDEFAVLLPMATEQGVVEASKRLIHAAGRPLMLRGERLNIGASVGVALYPEHGQTLEQLLQHADEAMYRAKAEGRGYAPTNGADVSERGDGGRS